MKIEFDPETLKPLLDAAVERALERVGLFDAKLGDRLGFIEPEAASLLGVEQHVLRDCRLRGEIHARKVGKRYVYGRDELIRFLRSKS